MARIRYIGDEAREVFMPNFGQPRRVEPDEFFEVDDSAAESYACQPHLYDVETSKPAAKATARKEG